MYNSIQITLKIRIEFNNFMEVSNIAILLFAIEIVPNATIKNLLNKLFVKLV